MRITYQQKHTGDITAANHADLASKSVEASLDSEGKKIEAGRIMLIREFLFLPVDGIIVSCRCFS